MHAGIVFKVMATQTSHANTANTDLTFNNLFLFPCRNSNFVDENCRYGFKINITFLNVIRQDFKASFNAQKLCVCLRDFSVDLHALQY